MHQQPQHPTSALLLATLPSQRYVGGHSPISKVGGHSPISKVRGGHSPISKVRGGICILGQDQAYLDFEVSSLASRTRLPLSSTDNVLGLGRGFGNTQLGLLAGLLEREMPIEEG